MLQSCIFPQLAGSQSVGQWNFSKEIRTQNIDKTLLIEQSSLGLRVSVKSGDMDVCVVPKHLIVGLPKIPLVPKEFFSQCRARLTSVDKEVKVYFDLPLQGGGNDISNSLRDARPTIQVFRTRNSIPDFERDREERRVVKEVYEDRSRIYRVIENYFKDFDSLEINNKESWYLVNQTLQKKLESSSGKDIRSILFENIKERIKELEKQRITLSKLVLQNAVIVTKCYNQFDVVNKSLVNFKNSNFNFDLTTLLFKDDWFSLIGLQEFYKKQINLADLATKNLDKNISKIDTLSTAMRLNKLYLIKNKYLDVNRICAALEEGKVVP